MKQFIAIFIALFLVNSYWMAKDNKAFLKIKERKLLKLKEKKRDFRKKNRLYPKSYYPKRDKKLWKKYPLVKRKRKIFLKKDQ